MRRRLALTHCLSVKNRKTVITILIGEVLNVRGILEIMEVYTMIKEVMEKDIAECVNLIRSSFFTVAEQFGFTEENAPRFTAFATTHDRLEWQLLAEHRPMYAYWDGDVIVGCYSLQLSDHNTCELSNLCVSPEYRHKGIGEELVKHAFHVAKELNYSNMNIGIVEENTILRKWYEELGFDHVGTKKFDFFPFTYGYMKKEL